MYGLLQQTKETLPKFLTLPYMHVIVTRCSLTLMYVFCRLDRKKNRKIFDWARHHQYYIDEWEMFDKNVDDNDEPHTNREYRQYQTWYLQATRPRLRLQSTHDDYTNIESSEDEDTTYDHSTRVGRQVGAGPILNRVVCHLLYFSISICVTMNYNFELRCRATPLGCCLKK
jgi:hypothetical protein